MLSAEEMEKYFKGIYSPKYDKEHEEGSFNFLAVDCCTHKMSIALWVRIQNFAMSHFFCSTTHAQYLCSAISPLWCSIINVQGFNRASIQNSAGFGACTWYTCFNYCFILYMYTVLDLPPVHTHASTIGLVLLYHLLGDFQCLSECFAYLRSNYPDFYVLTTLIAVF